MRRSTPIIPLICGATPCLCSLPVLGVTLVQRDELVTYLDDELDVEQYNEHEDAKFNGLLVAGRDTVEQVGLCTNFTWENIETAKRRGFDMVISHHGGWEEFEGDLVQEKKDALQDANISWYVAHEPLDNADGYGVAAALAEKLGVAIVGKFGAYCGGHAGRYGSLDVPEEEFLARLNDLDEYEVVDAEDRALDDVALEDARIGVIGGGGGVYMEFLAEAIEKDCDVYVTGNSAFYTDIYAYERGLTLVTLEETSSERWGVYALGQKLADRFDAAFVRMDERNW